MVIEHRDIERDGRSEDEIYESDRPGYPVKEKGIS